MDSRQIQEVILTKTYTKVDYLRRVTLIREFLESHYYKNFEGNFNLYLENNNIALSDRSALSHLDDSFFNMITKDNLYVIINSLIDSLKLLPPLTLYLAVILENEDIDKLGEWFRKHLHPELIMEVRCDPSLVSGCAYVWNNKFHDLSLHYFFLQKQDFINKIIDAYSNERL